MRNIKRYNHLKKPYHKKSQEIHKGYVYFSVDKEKSLGKCSLCNQDVYSDPSNIIIEEKQYHFECILDKLKSTFNLDTNQEFMYIGSLKFAVIWRSVSNPSNTEIVKKIDLKEILA